jgi:hypothetical protein
MDALVLPTERHGRALSLTVPHYLYRVPNRSKPTHQAAVSLLRSNGGKAHIFLATLPNVGVHTLKASLPIAPQASAMGLASALALCCTLSPWRAVCHGLRAGWEGKAGSCAAAPGGLGDQG